MDVEVDQEIDAPLELVEEAYIDPSFYAQLGAIGHIGPPQMIESRTEGDGSGLVHFKVRYSFGGSLSPPARAVLDPSKLTWTDTSVLDRSRHEVRFEMIPDHYAERLRFRGTNRFVRAGDGITRQVMKASLVVSYPVVGPLVERAIYLGIRENLSKEAEILAKWARGRDRKGR